MENNLKKNECQAKPSIKVKRLCVIKRCYSKPIAFNMTRREKCVDSGFDVVDSGFQVLDSRFVVSET